MHQVTAEPDGTSGGRRPDDGDPLDAAWQAWHNARRYGIADEQAVEATQAAALLSIAESLAALGPAVSAVAAALAPGVVGATTNAATALLEALTAQTAAIRAIGARLETLALPLRPVVLQDAETNDLDALVDSQPEPTTWREPSTNWRDLPYSLFLQWVAQRHGLPDGPIREADWDRFKAEYEREATGG